VLADLRTRFDDVLATLEHVAGWQTERIQRPVLILGQLEGVLTGIRQLRRTAPLETEEIDGLRVPTLAEMARIKAWLLVTRYTVRDYLDTVVLLGALGNQQGEEGRWLFGAGAITASLLWFFALAYGARLLSPLFCRPVAWRILDSLIALTLLALALNLFSA